MSDLAAQHLQWPSCGPKVEFFENVTGVHVLLSCDGCKLEIVLLYVWLCLSCTEQALPHSSVPSFLCLVPEEAKSSYQVEGSGYDTYLRDAHRQVRHHPPL